MRYIQPPTDEEVRDERARERAAVLLKQLPGSDERGEHDVTETAGVIHCEPEGGCFVQAWIWLPNEEGR